MIWWGAAPSVGHRRNWATEELRNPDFQDPEFSIPIDVLDAMYPAGVLSKGASSTQFLLPSHLLLKVGAASWPGKGADVNSSLLPTLWYPPVSQ